MKSIIKSMYILTIILICSITSIAQTNYYVSTTGVDTNPGTIGSPWRTIQHAANTVTAGSIVNVRAGVYNEQVNINVSGSAAGGYITFQSYPGETAIVDGTGLTVPTTDDIGLFNNMGSHSYIIIKGFEIRNYQTSTNGAVPVGIYTEGTSNHIQLLNNHIHHIQQNRTSANGTDALGIAFYGTSGTSSMNNIIIDGNEIDSCKTGSSETCTLNGNVEIFQVTNNKIHNNNNIGIDCIGYEGTAPANDRCRTGIVSGNTVYYIDARNNPAEGNSPDADGIYVDGGKNIVIERNTVYHCNFGIELGCEHAADSVTNVTVRNNFVYFSDAGGILMGGYDETVGMAVYCNVLNNTLYENDQLDQGDGEFMLQAKLYNNKIINNIAYTNSQSLLMTNPYTSNSGNTIDYNIYYCLAGTASAQFEWANKDYTGFAAYQTGSKMDAHGLFVNPLFVSLTPDLHLQQTSPAIDIGSVIDSVGTLDIDGNPRIVNGKITIGAQEKTNTTGINNQESLSPRSFELNQNYPNPFNPSTTISYSIPQQSVVTLKVYDILGNEVATLVNEVQQVGNHIITFNAGKLTSGIYFYKLTAGGFVQTKKMILMK
jgi:hypothetical protein